MVAKVSNEYTDNWLSTGKVKHFYFLEPKQEDILIEDIAHALSLQCRFGGHCPVFYSVAEHSVRVAGQLFKNNEDINTVLAGLLHDAEEAYLPDIPRPVKHVMPEAKYIYDCLSSAIVEKFGIRRADWKLVKKTDNSACLSEAMAFGLYDEHWASLGEPLDYFPKEGYGWNPDMAEKVFMIVFKYISGVVDETK
jgi:hypothetical protein